jgi:ribosomal protein L7Ae-like RNA K-turn-binding protein
LTHKQKHKSNIEPYKPTNEWTILCPNKKLPEDKIKEINDLSNHMTLGGIAKCVGVCTKTVKKYMDKKEELVKGF